MTDILRIRKKLKYRSFYRGMKELDLLLRRFSEENLPSLKEEELEKLEEVLDLPEKDLYEGLLKGDSILLNRYPFLKIIHESLRKEKKVPQLEGYPFKESESLFSLGCFLQESIKKNSQFRALILISQEEKALRYVENLKFFLNSQQVLWFPSWDCQPYDRLSPQRYIMGKRLHTLTQLALVPGSWIVVTTPAGFMQKLLPLSFFQNPFSLLHLNQKIERDTFLQFLRERGYERVDVVYQEGNYAVRGGVIDLFPIGSQNPVRMDWFGDNLDSLETLDVETQRRTGALKEILIPPAHEIILTQETGQLFKNSYQKEGGGGLFEKEIEDEYCEGVESLLPLFYSPENMSTLEDYGNFHVVFQEPSISLGMKERARSIQDHYVARFSEGLKKQENGKPFWKNHPVLPPSFLYGFEEEWEKFFEKKKPLLINPLDLFSKGFKYQESQINLKVPFIEKDLKKQMSFLSEKVKDYQEEGKKVFLSCVTEENKNNLKKILEDFTEFSFLDVSSWDEFESLSSQTLGLGVLKLESGFLSQRFVLLTEKDFLGDSLSLLHHKKRQKKKPTFQRKDLVSGQLVVHEDHGVGRYKGLKSLDVQGVFHDCLEIDYEGGDKLFLPVENMGLLSLYGQEGKEGSFLLDRLGSMAWQTRKARVKDRLQEMAVGLLKIAAERQKYPAPVFSYPSDYEDFCRRFPYPETEDQLKAIEDVQKDFETGHPMDRVICGDVGFGKTEVALRAAFWAVRAGFQVAVVVPTTLLCRQHAITFEERFKGLGVRVAQLSRLIPPSQASKIKEEISSGEVHIVVATHGILSSRIRWHQLGFMIVDEEHHFGVKQKEGLKWLQSNIHVLTLSATPIPRTLQMSLLGVRDLSLITTPPLDRFPVHTYVFTQNDEIIKEAILREYLRGGQIFYVSPRVEDLYFLEKYLKTLVPELKIAVAHGQLAPAQLDEIMVHFYDHLYDVLLSTHIIESGIDIPKANTLIVHRANLFGLAQLYQLRGRVGRGKIRGYAYFSVQDEDFLKDSAKKRLDVIKELNYLGAGFDLASHDLEIRGAGNLIGKEQSGHIRDVGVELYQELLQDALAECKGQSSFSGERWVPKINIGLSVMISENYVSDLRVRLSLYSQGADIKTIEKLEEFKEELWDRFGDPPEETKNFLEIIELKILCYKCHIEKLDAGPKGMSFRFRRDECPDPLGLANFLSQQKGAATLKADHRVVLCRSWESLEGRLRGIKEDLKDLDYFVEERKKHEKENRKE